MFTHLDATVQGLIVLKKDNFQLSNSVCFQPGMLTAQFILMNNNTSTTTTILTTTTSILISIV